MMVGVLLPRATPQTDDAADALAIAVTHAHHRASAVIAMALGTGRIGVQRERSSRRRREVTP
jgi:hypothetical protein